MGFLDFVENIQKKPEKVRYKILFASTFSIMAIIVILWLSVALVSSLEDKAENTSHASPFFIIKDTLANIYSSVHEAIR